MYSNSKELFWKSLEVSSEKAWKFLLPEVIYYNKILGTFSAWARELFMKSYEDKKIDSGFDSLHKINSTYGWVKLIGHLRDYVIINSF